MEYKTIYPFCVIDKIKGGKSVWMLDRKARAVDCVNEMTVADVVEILEKETERERFEFWYEEVAEDAEL